MKYKSCHLLEKGLYIGKDYISHCCLLPTTGVAPIKLFPPLDVSDIDIEDLIKIKREYKEMFKRGEIPPACRDCYSLEELDWSDDNEINCLYFAHWSHCNCNCIYCYFDPEREKNNSYNPPKVLPFLEKMKSKGMLNTASKGYMSFSGGECTILEEFSDILRFLFEIGSQKIIINSSGIKYDNLIAEGIQKGIVSCTISLDSADRELYKKIKQQDSFDKVVENIKKYVSVQSPDNYDGIRVKYIILPGINSDNKDLEKWLKLVKSLGVNHIILDFETVWFFKYRNEIPDKFIKMLFNVKKRAKQLNIKLSFYSHAMQALKDFDEKAEKSFLVKLKRFLFSI